MHIEFPFLTVLMLVPALGALLIFLFSKSESEASLNNSYIVAFWAALVNLCLTIVIYFRFDASSDLFQFTDSHQWIESFDIGYRVGIDGISLAFIMLTNIFMPICIIYSKNIIRTRVKTYLISFLLLNSAIIGVFISLDLILFYLFFELSLVPMFLIIGIWGGKDRIYASYKFFLYTFLGSILFLLSIIVLINGTGTTDLLKLYEIVPNLFDATYEKYLWFAFFAAFAVKIPMFPVHTWLPDAHVQAPTTGSIILAAILLKMGGYGFIRFSLPLFPASSAYFSEFVFILSSIAIIYTSIIAFSQTDIKKLIAYSSIAHMGFVTMGIFSLNEVALNGAMFQMISHGFISGSLFLLIGIIYEKTKTRNIKEIGGVASVMPIYSIFFVIFTFSSIALPSTSGFVGEFLILLGVYKVSPTYMFIASFGVILGAVYMLSLAKRMIMGEVLNDKIAALKDIGALEISLLGILAAFTIVLGIYPSIVTDIFEVSVHTLIVK